MLNKPTKPRLRVQDYPEHQAATDQLMDIRTRLTALDGETRDYLAARATTRPDHLQAAAEALLEGRPAPVQGPAGDGTYERLSQQRRVMVRAEEIAKRTLAEVEAKLSREICAALRPRYSEIVRTMDRALQVLLAASEAERAFRAEHELGVPSLATLESCPLARLLGRADDEYGAAAIWRRGAVEAGHLPQPKARAA